MIDRFIVYDALAAVSKMKWRVFGTPTKSTEFCVRKWHNIKKNISMVVVEMLYWWKTWSDTHIFIANLCLEGHDSSQYAKVEPVL